MLEAEKTRFESLIHDGRERLKVRLMLRFCLKWLHATQIVSKLESDSKRAQLTLLSRVYRGWSGVYRELSRRGLESSRAVNTAVKAFNRKEIARVYEALR